eukprot:TRINITY_DN5547_c0_g4_i1.p1 TRINITY_DN5547_c0_g4~~TRINITY_DN5547_c0_g4_i1.p1  ORF type:complete len:394 (-),score=95.49 TRINITY_DN5547_c0_g4_i1:29-1210(-)
MRSFTKFLIVLVITWVLFTFLLGSGFGNDRIEKKLDGVVSTYRTDVRQLEERNLNQLLIELRRKLNRQDSDVSEITEAIRQLVKRQSFSQIEKNDILGALDKLQSQVTSKGLKEKDPLKILPMITHRSTSPQLAAIIPFGEHQIDVLVSSLIQWGDRDVTACDGIAKSSYRAHLVLYFYFDQSLGDKPAIQRRITDEMKKISWINDCFSKVGFLDGKLPKSDGGKHLDYSWLNKQWSQVFRMDEMADADYFFYIEPDVVAIRDFWLDRIYEEVAWSIDDFWMKGSANRISMDRSFHIDRNAIYKLHDATFQSIFIDRILIETSMPFHRAIGMIFEKMKRGNDSEISLSKEIQHMLYFSDFFQLENDKNFQLEKFKRQHPNVVLVKLVDLKVST